MRKENLQEATQRALLEGYKNLNENKSKKVEAKEVKGMKDWKTDLMSDFKKGDLVSDDVVQEFRNSYPPITDTNKVVQGGEEYSYNQNGPTYITFTKVGNNWRFDGALNRIKEDKKVEGEEDTTSAPDYLEKAFEVEVEYWLKALVDENSNDEIGKKAQEVLDDKNKMKEIVNELVDGSDDLWEDIHRRIEELAGLHYRESSRVNESKKVTEAVEEDLTNMSKEEFKQWVMKQYEDVINNIEKFTIAREYGPYKTWGVFVYWKNLVNGRRPMPTYIPHPDKHNSDTLDTVLNTIEFDKEEHSYLYESKKVTEDVDEDKVNLYDTVWDQISCYDEEYAQEQGIDKLDDEDVYNIIAEIMSRPDVQDIIREEIEDYAGRKK